MFKVLICITIALALLCSALTVDAYNNRNTINRQDAEIISLRNQITVIKALIRYSDGE